MAVAKKSITFDRMQASFKLTEPDILTSCVVFASPHSGRDYGDEFMRQTVLDSLQIRSSEDAFVDDLFASAPRFGAPLLAARMPRSFVDLNRNADELDPALIDGVRPRGHNPRVTSGLGVIPRVVANGRQIYAGKIPMHVAYQRILQFWHPYHACQNDLLKRAHTQFGQAILLDCHSMPREALKGHLGRHTPRPDIVLGDRFGASASIEVVETVEAHFVAAGLRVMRNIPFAGAFNAQHYGRPSRNQHVIQIELDRGLYLDDKTLTPNSDFAAFQTCLEEVIAQLCRIGEYPLPLAAE